MNDRQMKIQARKTLFFLLLLILFSSCGNNGTKTTEEKKEDKSISITVLIPTQQEAIKHIQTFVSRSQQTVMVATNDYEKVQRKKRCDQYDYDLGRCSGADSGAKYGYKLVEEIIKTCCKSQETLVSNINGKWEAIYIESKKEWEVELQYNDDAEEEQKVSWSIKLSPSGGLQVLVGG